MAAAPKGKVAGTVRVGSKGQIVIPQEARVMLGIEPGDTLLLLADVDKGIAIVRGDAFRDFADAVLDAHRQPPTAPAGGSEGG